MVKVGLILKIWGVAKMRIQCVHMYVFHFFVMYFHDTLIFRKKTYVPILASDNNLHQTYYS